MFSITLCLRNNTVTVSATNLFGMNRTDQIVCSDDGAASLLVLIDSNDKVTNVFHGVSGESLTTDFPRFTVTADDLIRCAKLDGWNGVCNCVGL